MAIDGLWALRERLKSFAAMNQFFTDNYETEPKKHFIGYKRATNAAFLPALCYVPVQGTREDNEKTEAVSVIIQLNNKEESDDAFTGVLHINQLAELVVNDLIADEVVGDFFVDGKIEIVNALTESHPFYEIEIAFSLKNVNAGPY